MNMFKGTKVDFLLKHWLTFETVVTQITRLPHDWILVGIYQETCTPKKMKEYIIAAISTINRVFYKELRMNLPVPCDTRGILSMSYILIICKIVKLTVFVPLLVGFEYTIHTTWLDHLSVQFNFFVIFTDMCNHQQNQFWNIFIT